LSAPSSSCLASAMLFQPRPALIDFQSLLGCGYRFSGPGSGSHVESTGSMARL
jgi:hypothetical protein